VQAAGWAAGWAAELNPQEEIHKAIRTLMRLFEGKWLKSENGESQRKTARQRRKRGKFRKTLLTLR